MHPLPRAIRLVRALALAGAAGCASTASTPAAPAASTPAPTPPSASTPAPAAATAPQPGPTRAAAPSPPLGAPTQTDGIPGNCGTPVGCPVGPGSEEAIRRMNSMGAGPLPPPDLPRA